MKFIEINHVMTNTQPIKSLSEYIHAINYISHTFNDNLWYRGHAQDTYLNLPSMLRDGTWKDDDFSYRTEHDIFKTFKRKSKLKKETDYEYLHIMQHFGLPTRLLDFTESSLIALFFAIENPLECKNPVVWIIDPWDFNNVMHNEKIIFDFYGQTVHEKIDKYINPPENHITNMPELPIAVIPSFYDERVIAQKSGFILFGKDKTPLEELVKRQNYFNLAKIQIDTKGSSDILIDLNMAGIDYHTVFPDLDGLVKQIKSKWRLR
jgi:hypothetical protein